MSNMNAYKRRMPFILGVGTTFWLFVVEMELFELGVIPQYYVQDKIAWFQMIILLV